MLHFAQLWPSEEVLPARWSNVEIFSHLERQGCACIQIDPEGRIVALSPQAAAIFQDHRPGGQDSFETLGSQIVRTKLQGVVGKVYFNLLLRRSGRCLRAQARRLDVGPRTYIAIATKNWEFADS